MTGGPAPVRSSLARLIPERMDVEREKRKGWRNHGILVVAMEDPRLGWPEREMIKHLAQKIFGQHLGKETAHGQ
ncbi:MAG: hypothetical protein HQL80_07045 [Magnetococcales bacterium]|nr:hypothetical protein [Magnetococcales bacterium]MBF0583976.1 hypothetical protein [Magnetococcales bacterium]